jgi:hypothetical protein
VRTRDNVVHGVKSLPDLLAEFGALVKNHKWAKTTTTMVDVWWEREREEEVLGE